MKTRSLGSWACAVVLLLPAAAAAMGGCGGTVARLEGNDGGAGSGSSSTSSGGSSTSSGGGGSGSRSGTSSGSSGGVGSSTSGGGSGSSSGGSSGSSGGVSSGSSSGAGSGSSSGAGSGSSSGSAGGANGYITLEQCSGALCGSLEFVANAGFYPSTSSGCAPALVSGACQSFSCPTPATQAAVSAGTLTLSGGSLPLGLSMAPGGMGTYTYSTSGAYFTAGETLRVSASGGVVPPFAASVVAPGPVTLTAPAKSGTTYTIPTASDLALAWEGPLLANGARMIVEGVDTASGHYFDCLWDASLGRAVVPQTILAGFAGQTGAYLAYGSITTSKLEVGGYAIAISALQAGGGQATFQ